MRKIGVLALFSMVGLLLSCGEEYSIDLAEPADGSTITETEAFFRVSIGGNFVPDPDAIGERAVEGRGHWELFVDEKRIATTADTEVLIQFNALDLEPGNHQFRAELVNNDRTPLKPPVFDVIELNLSSESVGR